MNRRSFFFIGIFSLILLGSGSVFAQDATKEAEQLDFAQGLIARGMYDMAILQCQKFIADYPKSPSLQEAYLSLGEGYFLSQDFKNAVNTFNQFKQLFPHSDQMPVGVLRLGQIDIQQKSYDDAIKELTSIDLLQLKDQMLQSFDFYMAQAYMGKLDTTNALVFFQKAGQMQGAYTAYALKEVGKIDAQTGHYADAMQAYTQAAQLVKDNALKGELVYKVAELNFLSGRYEEAIKGFKQVLDQYAGLGFDHDALANILLAYFNLGQYDQLLDQYNQKSKELKDDDVYFGIHYAAVQASIELKKYDQASTILDRVLAFSNLKNQERAKVFIKKADILVRQGRYKDALALLEAYSSQDIGDADETFFLKAQAYYGLGDFDHAFNFFENVYLNFPGSRFFKAALLGQAHARQETGRYKESEVLFLKYHDIQDDPELKSDALFDAVMMAVKAEDVAGAINAAQEYLKSFPQASAYSDVLFILADNYSKNNQAQDAITLLKGYLSNGASVSRPNSAYFLLAYNEQILGQNDEALKAYALVDEHKEAGKFYLGALKNMAIIYLNQGKKDQARIYFDRLISQADANDLQIKTYIWVCNEYLKQQAFQDVLRIAAQAERRFAPEDLFEIKYFKAEALRGLGRCDEAIKNYDVLKSSTQKDAYTGSAHIGDGLCLAKLKNFDGAKAEFQSALDENADDYTITIHARFEMANLEASAGHLDEALKYYLLIATIYDDPNYCSQSLLKSAKILEEMKRKDDAIKMYSEILEKYKASDAAIYAGERMRFLK